MFKVLGLGDDLLAVSVFILIYLIFLFNTGPKISYYEKNVS